MNGVDKTLYCDILISMVGFIINKLMANDYQEFRYKMLRFEDKYSHGLTPVKQLFDFYGQHYRCVTNEPSIDCSQFSPKLSLLSPSGKCHTFLSNNFDQIYVKSINILINIFVLGGASISRYPHFLSYKVLLNDKATLLSTNLVEIIPISIDDLISRDMTIKLKKTVIKRLEKPYDTECHDYGDSNQINCLTF